jgi:flagellar biogenesis protein FliO
MKAGEKMAAGNNATEGRLAGVAVGGLAGWLLSRFRSGGSRPPRLALLERIALAPRQSLALVEAEGRRFLVATSPEGAPAFFALDERVLRPKIARQGVSSQQGATRPAERVSW